MFEVRQERLLAAWGLTSYSFCMAVIRRFALWAVSCNQGLVLLLFYGAVSIVAHIVPVIGETLLLPAAKLMWLLLALWGVLAQYRGGCVGCR